MKKILGLDLGTNSIGWAVINSSNENNNPEQLINISSAGSRIIPMDAATLSDFDKGNTKSQTAERTKLRGVRRLLERCLLRRERLLRVLSIMNFLPPHYESQINRYGKFINDSEPKLAWERTSDGRFEFIFKQSFLEMLDEFRSQHPTLLKNGKKIPYDWTLYYLRKKALSQKIRKEELAWILLSFNQKRGYYQLRGEDDEEQNTKKQVKYYALKVISVEDSGDKKGRDTWYNIKLENGYIYRRTSSEPLDWVGKIKEFIITTELDEQGHPKKDKDGEIKYSIRLPKEDDWGLIKIKTQEQIDAGNKTVGAYIYDNLLANPMQKIRGKLVHTIDRQYYQKELTQILRKQQEFHAELQDKDLLESCIKELYPNNIAHKNLLLSNDFCHFLTSDILFYQRPLRSKKSLIDDCPYESHIYRKGNELHHTPLKCTTKSHPLFQEFRLWQFISNLRIYQKEKSVNGSLKTDVDVTSDFLRTEEDYAALFEWLNKQKEIGQKTFLAYKPFNLGKKERANYRWNYVEDKNYPCNETRTEIISRLEKAEIDPSFLSKDQEEKLWHILYSISDKQELTKALQTYATKNGLTKKFVEAFAKIPPFKNNYAAYSLKAIKRLLPLMRMGKYWNREAIDSQTQKRIEKIINGEWDESIRNRVREKSIHLTNLDSFRALPLWLACYIVYDRHSESKEIDRWEKPEDIDIYLKHFKQHSLRNPIVEQVITETLRTVRDIWKQEGQIDEIHIELGREMKNPADKRKRISEQALQNEYTNLRIKALLTEFMNPEFGIENVRPYSPTQQDILRIYEEGALQSVSGQEIPEDIRNILERFNETDTKKRPSHSEIMRYKLWLEQKYQSPYTGKVISLSKLFTSAYEIEHIIPQSRYFDDSFSNKVICESAVNKLKSNLLGYEFIKKHHGEKVELGNGEVATIFTVADYEQFIKDHYTSSLTKSKKEKLLLEDIPNTFIERQLNDSRYISKLIKTLLSNLVREQDEQDSISKNIIICTGGITDKLKKDWGIQDIWNRIILPRFQRLNQITDSTDYTTINTNGHLIPAMPLASQKGFNKKRIDHRHHAMDAIIIACANRNIVNYLNNSSASKNAQTTRYDLQRLLCDKVKTDENNYKWIIRKPWESFTQDVYETLLNIVVSFKQNLRVINRTTNYYQHYDCQGKKNIVKQTKGDSWAIRKPMHKDTVYGEVNLRKEKTVLLKEAINYPQRIIDKVLKKKIIELLKIGYQYKDINQYFESHKEEWTGSNLKKIEVYYFTKETKERFFATRKPLDTSFNQKKIENEVTDTGIQKILLAHLLHHNNNANIAFSPDGIEELNNNIQALNGGRPHQPIYKVRVYEKADKFPIGKRGSKSTKFVEAAKGTNLFFAVYEQESLDKETGKTFRKRTYASIPLNQVIDRQKKGLSSAPEDKNGHSLIFILSPNDLVYLPTKEEIRTGEIEMPIHKERIYKMVSCTAKRLFVIPYNLSSIILDKIEYSSMNKIELTDEKISIKEFCIPLSIDRLGNISIRHYLNAPTI